MAANSLSADWLGAKFVGDPPGRSKNRVVMQAHVFRHMCFSEANRFATASRLSTLVYIILRPNYCLSKVRSNKASNERFRLVFAASGCCGMHRHSAIYPRGVFHPACLARTDLGGAACALPSGLGRSCRCRGPPCFLQLGKHLGAFATTRMNVMLGMHNCCLTMRYW